MNVKQLSTFIKLQVNWFYLCKWTSNYVKGSKYRLHLSRLDNYDWWRCPRVRNPDIGETLGLRLWKVEKRVRRGFFGQPAGRYLLRGRGIRAPPRPWRSRGTGASNQIHRWRCPRRRRPWASRTRNSNNAAYPCGSDRAVQISAQPSRIERMAEAETPAVYLDKSKSGHLDVLVVQKVTPGPVGAVARHPVLLAQLGFVLGIPDDVAQLASAVGELALKKSFPFHCSDKLKAPSATASPDPQRYTWISP